MTAQITLTVTFDEEYLASQADRRGVGTDVISRELLGDVECLVFDSIRWRDGIDAGRLRSEARLLVGAPA